MRSSIYPTRHETPVKRSPDVFCGEESSLGALLDSVKHDTHQRAFFHTPGHRVSQEWVAQAGTVGAGTPAAHDNKQALLDQCIRDPRGHPHNLKVVGSNSTPANQIGPADHSLMARSPCFFHVPKPDFKPPTRKSTCCNELHGFRLRYDPFLSALGHMRGRLVRIASVPV
jgi:hypothetical protein